MRPKLDADADTNVARLIDYADALDVWVHRYAWPLCKKVKP